MTDFLNKVVTVFLVFLMLVLAPLVLSYMHHDLLAHRLVLNEVTQFIDKVTDKKNINEDDLNDLNLGVNASGGIFNVEVKRLIRAESVNPDGTTRTIYFSSDDFEVMNKGDVVKVTVEEVGRSTASRLIWAVLRIDEGKFNFSLAGSIR